MSDKPNVPAEHYTREYFEKWNYADRGLGKFSMYWFARRYYAALARRYAPPIPSLLPPPHDMERGSEPNAGCWKWAAA